MKDFLSEYGFAILAAIVVILLIAMCTPVGNLIKNQIMGVVDSFATKTESKLYSMDADNTLGVVITQLDENGKFKIVASSDSETDALVASYRVKDQHGNWTEWKELGTLSTGSKEHSGEFTAKIENGNKAQVRVVDSGKADNLFYESNIVEYTGASSEQGEFTGGSSSTGSCETPATTITDLTGYTWVGNDNLPDSMFTTVTYNINFLSGGDEWQQIVISPYVMGYEIPEQPDGFSAGESVYLKGEGWEWSEYKTIQIEGGADVTNTALIALLQANGTLTK